MRGREKERDRDTQGNRLRELSPLLGHSRDAHDGQGAKTIPEPGTPPRSPPSLAGTPSREHHPRPPARSWTREPGARVGSQRCWTQQLHVRTRHRPLFPSIRWGRLGWARRGLFKLRAALPALGGCTGAYGELASLSWGLSGSSHRGQSCEAGAEPTGTKARGPAWGASRQQTLPPSASSPGPARDLGPGRAELNTQGRGQCGAKGRARARVASPWVCTLCDHSLPPPLHPAEGLGSCPPTHHRSWGSSAAKRTHRTL